MANWESAFGVDLDISGMHLVSSSMTIAGFVLQPGDLLVNFDGSVTLPRDGGGTVAIERNDVVRFRPSTIGNYSSGTFAMLLDDPLGAELRGLTLVEQSTQVGEVVLSPGTFLMTRAGGSEHQDVWRFVPASVGTGSTSGAVSVLLQGEEMGFTGQIWSLELVEDGLGWPFRRGQSSSALTPTAPSASMA